VLDAARRSDGRRTLLPPSQARRWRKLGVIALSAALAVVAVAATSWLSPGVTWTLLVMAALTSPWVWRVLRRGAPSGCAEAASAPPRPAVAPVEAVPEESSVAEPAATTTQEPAPVPVSSMTDQELCRAFRRSFVLLSRTVSLPERLRLVSLRQAYLDEMSRRDPGGFQFWLESGARAASGPDKFLRRSPGPGEPDAA
jgi:hypothetical protein